jgi:hypothetical protein
MPLDMCEGQILIIKKRVKMKIGNKVKCIMHTSTGPALAPGDGPFTVKEVTKNKTFKTKEHGNYYFYVHEFEVVTETIEEITEALKELTKQYNAKALELNNRIKYMRETGLAEYDETEFKVWSILSQLAEGADQLTTAKAIAKIVNS